MNPKKKRSVRFYGICGHFKVSNPTSLLKNFGMDLHRNYIKFHRFYSQCSLSLYSCYIPYRMTYWQNLSSRRFAEAYSDVKRKILRMFSYVCLSKYWLIFICFYLRMYPTPPIVAHQIAHKPCDLFWSVAGDEIDILLLLNAQDANQMHEVVFNT